MSSKTSYLLLLSIENAQEFNFQNSLEASVRSAIGRSDLFAMDNFSETAIINYAKQFVEKSEQLVLICDEMKTTSLGAWMPVLNLAIKQKHVKLIVKKESTALNPFIKMMRGKVSSSEAELVKELTQ